MVQAVPALLAARIERAAVLLADRPAEARSEAQAILAQAPNDPRALLILASAHRRLGDAPAALAILVPLARAFPRAAKTQYELGLVLAAHGETASAIVALRQATAVDRELGDAWRALGDLLFRAGDSAGADAAFAEHRRSRLTDPQLRQAAEALIAGEVARAEALLRARVSADPRDGAALQLLAEVYMHQSRYGDAEVLLAERLSLDPDLADARFRYADALFKQQKAEPALSEVLKLRALDPKDASYRNLHAACLGLLGDDAGAVALNEGLLEEYPDQPMLWLNHGHALRAVGRFDDAVGAYRRCIARAPECGDAYWSLANLKVTRFTTEDIGAMQALLDNPALLATDRLHLHYALGKALEDTGGAGPAFANYAAGARLRRATGAYDAADTTAQMRRAAAAFTSDIMETHAGGGSPSTAPIFIVGLPRAGSTLVEQILASHSAVEGTAELPDIGLIARRLGPAYPEVLADLDADRTLRLGEDYLASTRYYRKLGRAHFIDKMPNNFQHIGLIHLILPRAKIIDVRRHPMASCFSAFKQHFAQGQMFSYDLDDVGRYYRDYVGLMNHIDAVCPTLVHRVIYEDLVQDTEQQVRRLLAYCELPFEEACLAFHKNDRAVRTVSSEQVRRPIFRDGLEQWRKFEPYLEPLKAALGSTLANWRGAIPQPVGL